MEPFYGKKQLQSAFETFPLRKISPSFPRRYAAEGQNKCSPAVLLCVPRLRLQRVPLQSFPSPSRPRTPTLEQYFATRAAPLDDPATTGIDLYRVLFLYARWAFSMKELRLFEDPSYSTHVCQSIRTAYKLAPVHRDVSMKLSKRCRVAAIAG